MILRATVLAATFALSAMSPVFAADGGREDGQAWVVNPGPASVTVSTVPPARAAVQSQARSTTGTSYQMARDMSMSGT